MKLLCKNAWYKLCAIVCYLLLNPTYATHTMPSCLPFHRGEKLTYQMSIMSIPVINAIMHIDDQIHYINNRPCYKLQLKAASNKKIERLYKFTSIWQSYLDKDFLRPNKSIGHMRDNTYIRKESIIFDYKNNQAKIELFENQSNGTSKTIYLPISNNMQDLLSGYYALRHIDTKKLKKGDQLKINVLYDQQIYKDLGIKFEGIEIITTPLGKISSLIFTPMISNELLSGKQPIKLFISNDSNKILLKLHCNLTIGKIALELTHCQGLNEELVFYKS